MDEPTEPPPTKYSTEAIGFASEALTPSVTLPETIEPASGDESEPVGAVLSTIFDARSTMFSLPASSRTMKRRSHEPSSAGVVAQNAVYGGLSAPVVSTPSDVHVEALESLCWNSTSVTSAPPPPPPLGFAVSVTVPRR